MGSRIPREEATTASESESACGPPRRGTPSGWNGGAPLAREAAAEGELFTEIASSNRIHFWKQTIGFTEQIPVQFSDCRHEASMCSSSIQLTKLHHILSIELVFRFG